MRPRFTLLAMFVATNLCAAPSPLARLVDEYCADCHDGHVESTGTYIEPLDVQDIAANPHLWSSTERHLRAGTMPPVGSPRPDRRTNEQAITAIERALDASVPTDTSQAIATRLAMFLWNAEPDKALLQSAQRDQLRDAATLEREVRRMLADPRAEAFVSRFLFPWLQLDKLDQVTPDKRAVPDYNASLRDSMRRETELFLLSQLRDDRDPAELWTANYTYLNEQLAKHYGIDGVAGASFRRVTLASPERAGLLGQASVLTVTARFQPGTEGGYTSPASRGKWILTRFMGVAAPSAFPGAQPIRPDLPVAGQARALPQDPCRDCHRNFFPLGDGLENFDAIGRWRTADQVAPVDASGALVDGTPFSGPAQLRKGLMQRPDAFRTTIAERLLVYAAGGAFAKHEGSPQTLTAARSILRNTSQVRWSTLIAGVVRQKPLTLD